MALEQKLSLKMSQKLVMTPSLQQAIKLLQMTRLELEGVLTQELVENPLLEETAEQLEEDSDKEEEKEKEEDAFDEIDFEAFFGEYYEGSSHASIREDREEFRFETNLTQEPDLYDHLTWQLHMCDCTATRRRIAEMIIGNLDPEGFLLASRTELCRLAEGELVPVNGASHAGVHSVGVLAGGEELADNAPDAVDHEAARVAASLIAERLDADERAYGASGEAAEKTATFDQDAEAPVSVWADADDLVLRRVQKAQAQQEAAQPDATEKAEAQVEAAEGTDATAGLEDGGEEDPYQLFPRALVDEVDRALALVQSFDPPGIAHYDLRTSLLAQLDHRNAETEYAEGEDDDPYQLARRMISEDWQAFLKRQFPALAKQYGVELKRLEPAVEKVRELETRPGRRFNTETARYIEPDVAVQKIGGEYVIQLNDDGLPRLRVSRAYRQMLRKMKSEGNNGEAQSFIKDKMRSAIWLIKSLDQRQRTIYKVARSIVDQQKDFLDHGIEHLRPMVLRDVAEDIQMHESTVSRVVSNKYINTPRGLLPMKFFFHSGIDREYGENISSLTVKRKLEKLIEDEDAKKPLSDSELMRILKREGIQIARRTVAKYRDELSIPSSTERKQIF